MIQKVGSDALNQLSTKLRPNKRYETNRADLDGSGIDYSISIYTDVTALTNPLYNPGAAFDILKALGKLTKPPKRVNSQREESFRAGSMKSGPPGDFVETSRTWWKCVSQGSLGMSVEMKLLLRGSGGHKCCSLFGLKRQSPSLFMS